MTSRPYSGRTGRINRNPVSGRGIRKRGLLPSFGDIILPIVSVAAIGLLIIAGRQFFVNGMKTSPGISSTRAFAEAPALVAERERREAEEAPAPPVAQANTSAPVSAEPAVKEDTAPALTEVLAVPQVQTAQVIPLKTVTPSPAASSKKTTSSAAATKKTTPAKTSAPAKTTTPAKTSALPANKQWRVQVGAYGSKEGAQKEADKIKKAGYKATIYSNPASKYVKVWVQGGADKASAEKVVNAMKKLGYKGSFSFPPAK